MKTNSTKATKSEVAMFIEQIRKGNLLAIRRWRQGLQEAYLVCTYIDSASMDYNGDPEGFTSEIFFDLTDAKKRYNELCSSEIPSMDQGGFIKTNRCYFVTQLLQMRSVLAINERLQITTIEELKTAILNDREEVQVNMYAPSIEDKDVVVTLGKNRWNQYDENIIKDVEPRRTWSAWIGDYYMSEQKTTADLRCDQIALTKEEFKEKYPDEEILNYNL